MLACSRAGICARLFYVLSVALGCISFILWGCYCDDPAAGYPNKWNRVYTVKEKLQDEGSYVHACHVHFSALLGLEWCVTVGVVAALHLYISLPILVKLVLWYPVREMLSTLAMGILTSGGLFAMLHFAVAGRDPPPGLGISGVPLGGSVAASSLSLVLFLSGAWFGYRHNERFGSFTRFVAAFSLLATGLGVVATFYVHAGVGFMIPLDMLAAGGFATQVFLAEGLYLLTYRRTN